MATWWRTSNFGTLKIEEVEVVRETRSAIFFIEHGGHTRNYKDSDGLHYRQTREGAVMAMVHELRSKVDNAQRLLDQRKKLLEEAEKL